MTERNPDQAMLSLQSELDAMARETPEIPESFQKGWREAIRKEASASAAAEQAATPTQQAIPFPRRPRIAIWRAALNFAAIALFVLGGTLLGRESVSLLRTRPESSSLRSESTLAPEAVTAEEAGAAYEAAVFDAEEEMISDAAIPETETAGEAYEMTDAVAEDTDTAYDETAPAVEEAGEAYVAASFDAEEEAEEYDTAAFDSEEEEAVDADAFAMKENSATFGAAASFAKSAGKVMNTAVPVAEEAMEEVNSSDVASPVMEDDTEAFDAAVPVVEEAAGAFDAAAPVVEEAMEETEAFDAAAPAVEKASEIGEVVPAAGVGTGDSEAEAVPEELPEQSPEELPEECTEGPNGSTPEEAPRTGHWLLGGILIGLAVFCWVFLAVTRKSTGKKKAKGIFPDQGNG